MQMLLGGSLMMLTMISDGQTHLQYMVTVDDMVASRDYRDT